MTRYTVVEAKRWRHTSGRTASVRGACPWTSPAERQDWTMETVGWSVADIRLGTVGCGRPPCATREEAEALAASFNG